MLFQIIYQIVWNGICERVDKFSVVCKRNSKTTSTTTATMMICVLSAKMWKYLMFYIFGCCCLCIVYILCMYIWMNVNLYHLFTFMKICTYRIRVYGYANFICNTHFFFVCSFYSLCINKIHITFAAMYLSLIEAHIKAFGSYISVFLFFFFQPDISLDEKKNRSSRFSTW